MKKLYYDTVKPYLNRIPAWRKQGLTEKQVAKRLGIAYSTLNNYKLEHLELMEALKKGREELVEELEMSLYRKAMGFEYEETEEYVEMKGDKIAVKRKKIIKKNALPDTGALAFALKNLDPENWKDKRENQISGEIKTNSFDELTAEELRKLIDSE